jgi:hypothetical protein
MDPKECFKRILESSENPVLKKLAGDIEDWSKLAHEKGCLELILRKNVVLLKVWNGNSSEERLVSSDETYIGFLERNRNPEKRNRLVNILLSDPRYKTFLKTKRRDIVRTWDLIRNDKFEVSMSRKWKILGWVGISDGNEELMGKITAEILTKGNHK